MNRHLSQPSVLIALVLLVCFTAVGCGLAAAPTPTVEPSVPVRVQLAWTHEYSSAFFYAAELNHHFDEEHLDVSLSEGGFVDGSYVEPIDEVLSGEFDFGAASASGLLQARADGKPVVAIATIFQRNPTAIISLPESDINQPQDLIGKTVAVAEGGATRVLQTMLISQGIELDQVTIIPREGFGIEPLINHDVDALVGWIINEGVLVREAGEEPNFMLMNDYGISDYNIIIFTTEENVTERPEVVERFLRALIAGLQDMVDNPEQSADYTLQFNDQLDRAEQLSRLQASIPLINPARSQLAMMEPDAWSRISEVLVDSDILTNAVDPATAYDLSFLNTIYSQ
jgi:ABC-type nitrate/sulfonate/bicarbonate transport system substrate-binding protein